MTQKLKITGMKCAHCADRMKKALEALAGVTVTRISAADSTAEIESAAPVDEALLRETVAGAGYQFEGISHADRP